MVIRNASGAARWRVRGRAAALLSSLATLAALAVFPGCEDDPAPPCTGPECDGEPVITTIAGNGQRGFGGDGMPAVESALYFPNDLFFDTQGRLVFLDWNNYRVRRVDADGKLRTIIGNERTAPAVAGTPALESSLPHAYSIAGDDAGRLYIAGHHQPQILEVDETGMVVIPAGTGAFGDSGDGGPATAATFGSPMGVAVGPTGFPIFVADWEHHRIRKIDAQGVITTIAGDGTPGYTGDGGPAVLAKIYVPNRVRFDPASGSVYVSDAGNHAIRRIAPDGTITTVAGTGAAGFSGDGGPATAAQLSGPNDARIGPDGALYIADTSNNRIRRVGPDGVIVTVAGGGDRGGFSGDGGPPTEARLDHPLAMAFDPEGNLVITDTINSRIRFVSKTALPAP